MGLIMCPEQNDGVDYEKVKILKNNNRIVVIIKRKIYDVTDFINKHPGGRESILDYNGLDATKAFEEIGHSPYAIRKLEQYIVN